MADAQAFYADKTLRVPFELHLPREQYGELVKAGTVSAEGKLSHPDAFLKQPKNEYQQAADLKQVNPSSTAARLRQIPQLHGDVEQFNQNVLNGLVVRPLSATYAEVQSASSATAAVRKQCLEQFAYKAYLESLPSDFKVATNSALVAGALTTFDKLWREGVSANSLEEAVMGGSLTGGKAFGSTYIASGVIRSLLDHAVGGSWEKFNAPGEGEDWRLDDAQFSGSALLWENQVVIHLQLFPKSGSGQQDEAGAYRPRIRRRYGRGGSRSDPGNVE